MADGYLVDDDDIKKIAEFVKSGDKELADNIKALQYIIDNSNRLNYTGQVITNSNSVSGDIKNVIINGNTRYKKTDGSYTDTWESGVSLESVGESENDSNGKYPITIKSIDNSKNLIEKSNIITGYYYDENNTLQPNPNMNTLKKLINVKSGATYYIKNSSNISTNVTYILYFTETNTLIKCEYDKNIVTIPDNCAKIRFSGSNLNELCFSLNNFYSEYKEDKRTILLDSPLRKVEEVADILDLDNSQITRKSKTITIDKNITNWGQGRIDSNSILWYTILSDVKPSSPIICDKLKYDKTTWLNDTIGICNLDETKAFQIRVDKTISTVSALTTWLTNNPLTIVYELATPVVETVAIKPTDNPLQSYNDNTTLTLNNAIKGSISADIPTNVNAIIVNQASEIAKLQNSLLETQSALIETQYNSLT